MRTTVKRPRFVFKQIICGFPSLTGLDVCLLQMEARLQTLSHCKNYTAQIFSYDFYNIRRTIKHLH